MAGWSDFPTPSGAAIGGWGARPPGTNAAIPEAPPTPAPVKGERASRRMRLHSVNDVQRELRRIYVEARNGTVKAADATKLAYILNMLANLMVDSDLEERVNAALEAEGSTR